MTFVTKGSVIGTRSRTTARIRAETAISQCAESRVFEKRSPAEPSAQSGISAASGPAPRRQERLTAARCSLLVSNMPPSFCAARASCFRARWLSRSARDTPVPCRRFFFWLLALPMILRTAPSVVSEVTWFRFASDGLSGELARICIHARSALTTRWTLRSCSSGSGQARPGSRRPPKRDER